MASSRTVIFLTLALVVAATAAPLEESAGQDSKPITTTVAPLSTALPEASTQATGTSSASTTQTSSSPTDSTLAMTDTSAYTNTTFTCYGKSLGYYADIVQKCKVYHFCLLGEYNGEPIYQRVSYLCMNDKVFDQQALDCVKEAELRASCDKSPAYYDISNSVLRKAVLGNQASNEVEAAKSDEEHKNISTTTAP